MRATSLVEGVFSLAGGAQVVAGLVVGDAGLPSAPPLTSSAVTIPVWAISLLIGGGLSLVGFLLKRALDQLDSKLNRLDTKLEEAAVHRETVERRLAVVETKIDTLTYR